MERHVIQHRMHIGRPDAPDIRKRFPSKGNRIALIKPNLPMQRSGHQEQYNEADNNPRAPTIPTLIMCRWDG